MESIFDIIAIGLFIATACIFALRFRHETTSIAPYALVAIVCAVGDWLGNHGGGAAAVGLLIGASFLLLHLASLPYRDDAEEGRKG